MAIAGRTGLAHYSMQTRRWKLFGNETQEKDFIVAGGLLWWRDYIVMGCYSIPENSDELRFYPRDSKLDNKFAKIVTLLSPVLLMNILQDQLITFGSDAQVTIWALKHNPAGSYFLPNYFYYYLSIFSWKCGRIQSTSGGHICFGGPSGMHCFGDLNFIAY